MSAREPIIALIVAMDEAGVIGRGEALPWRLSSDLKRFRALTMGKPLIMGRRTFASIGRPLDGRDNIVLTRDRSFAATGIFIVHSTEEARALATECARKRDADEIMVIGGAEIYRAFLPLAKRIYLTRVHARVPGDVHFPELAPDAWRTVSEVHHAAGPRDDYDYSCLLLERAPETRSSAPGINPIQDN